MEHTDWNDLNDERFDALLTDSLPELVPDDIAAEVTPWKQATNRILIGLGLTSLTLNFLCLNYILPSIGAILVLLGFRTLRGENRWFRCGFVAAAIRTICLLVVLVSNTTIWPSLASFAMLFRILGASLLLFLLFIYVFLWMGLRAVQRGAGMLVRVRGAAGLIVWYGILCLLALVQYRGIVIGIVMVIAYLRILFSLRRLAQDLEETGYAIRTAPIHTTDLRLSLSLCIILIIGMTFGYAAGGTYPMNWDPVAENGQTDVQEIRSHLLELGFPEEVLRDLTDEDVSACAGADRVVVDVTDEPVNDGRTVTTRTEEGDRTHIHQSTVYDVRELHITGIGVRIPGERERWILFHHFLWTTDPGFRGTESIQLWPAWQGMEERWSPDGTLTGRVLCDMDGQTLAAPFYSLETERFQQNSIFQAPETRSDPFACFSFPREAKNMRGYLTYRILQNEDGWLVNSWFNYTHQRTWLQYPVVTAMEKRMTDSWNAAGAFLTVQYALQFYPDGEEIVMIS